MTRKQYYILETETQNMMHYVSYVNLRRDFVEEMCFKKSILHEWTSIHIDRDREEERERENCGCRPEIKIDSIRLLTR